MNEAIITYNNAQDSTTKLVCEKLSEIIQKTLSGSESKVWHGSPVWFIDGNPIVGYAVRKQGIQLLFWSGQSFDEPGLKPEGSFKAAEKNYLTSEEIKNDEIIRWLQKAAVIQWDYKNIVKNRGTLHRLK